MHPQRNTPKTFASFRLMLSMGLCGYTHTCAHTHTHTHKIRISLLPLACPDRVFLLPPPLCCRFPASQAGQAQRTKVNTVPSSRPSPPPSPLRRPHPDGPLGPLASLSCFCSAGSLSRQTDSSSLSLGRPDWSRAVRPIYIRPILDVYYLTLDISQALLTTCNMNVIQFKWKYFRFKIR